MDSTLTRTLLNVWHEEQRQLGRQKEIHHHNEKAYLMKCLVDVQLTLGYNLSVFYLRSILLLIYLKSLFDHCSLMSVCQSLAASFTQRSQPYSPLFFFSVISLSSLPVSIFHVLSFTVSQLTKHFFFTFICFSSPSLISPLLSQSLTVLHLATIFLPLFSFFSLSLISQTLSPSFLCSQWKLLLLLRRLLCS